MHERAQPRGPHRGHHPHGCAAGRSSHTLTACRARTAHWLQRSHMPIAGTARTPLARARGPPGCSRSPVAYPVGLRPGAGCQGPARLARHTASTSPACLRLRTPPCTAPTRRGGHDTSHGQRRPGSDSTRHAGRRVLVSGCLGGVAHAQGVDRPAHGGTRPRAGPGSTRKGRIRRSFVCKSGCEASADLIDHEAGAHDQANADSCVSVCLTTAARPPARPAWRDRRRRACRRHRTGSVTKRLLCIPV